jgi:uncharacterized damage-inducible protein DinB
MIDEQGRPEPEPAGDELTTLTGFLDYQRATFGWKTRGLDVAALRVTTAASSMTLGGIMKHLAFVEENWFSVMLHGRAALPIWDPVYLGDFDWPFVSSVNDAPEELRRLWEEAIDRSRSDVALALERGGLDQLTTTKWDNGEAPSLRWVLVHMIEEYARHNGHADLLRESIDGETGE